jgi:hypothetical protein
MNSFQAILATLTLFPLRAVVTSCRWMGQSIFFLFKWLSFIGWGLAAVWLVLGLIYFILTITGVVPAFEGFGLKQWWDAFFVFLASPLVWLLVVLSPLAWTAYILIADEGLSRLALGTLGIALSGLILWCFYMFAQNVIARSKSTNQSRARKPARPII